MWGGVLRYYYAHRLAHWRYRTGIDLYVNVAGPGLRISHGKVVINAASRLGEHCVVRSDVTVGIRENTPTARAPRIGDRVVIGTGARVIGDVEIADDIVIGANAVVTHSFTEPGITIAGVPARKIRDAGPRELAK